MPTFHPALLLTITLSLAIAVPAQGHIVGQDGDKAEGAEVVDIEDLMKKMAGQRGDIREQQGQPADTFPENSITLSPLVKRILDDELTTEEQRTQMRIFHGQWEQLGDLDALPLEQRAQLALLRYELDHASLRDPKTDPLLRAQAALLRGEPELALEVLTGVGGLQAAALRGRAFEDTGRLPEAVRAYTLVKTLIDEHGRVESSAAVVNAVARAVSDLARLEGRPAAEYHAVMGWLGRIYAELDPLYWPARVTEAQLLTEKSNLPEAGKTWLETLAVNPRSGEAWYGLGSLSVRTYNFSRAANAVAQLRAVNPTHLLADIVEVRSFLQQKDVDSARAVLEPAILRYPTQRELSALLAATEAMAYDQEATRRVLLDHDALAPGSPYAYAVVGSTLSAARQYDWSIAMLDEAITRAPGWAEPRLELGLVLMQKGDLPRARAELEKARAIDPFNTRVNNQLTLVREMLDYATIETEHFIIRYQPGIDEVLARDMAQHADRLYTEFTGFFGHEPPVKTQIDIMPDADHFAVRITGLPDIWTIAACTGDVLALTPPRVGPKQKGHFDWHNVVGHEYVHTITLSQTHNRIPHWFTEACAVSRETTGRTWDQHQLLAWALHNDRLFTLDQINWGFIRPTTPRDRPLAYAQAAWMLEYLIEKHGRESMVELLDLYALGTSNTAGVQKVTGQPTEEFFSAFKAWASEQVAEWGLDQEPAPEKADSDLAALAYGKPQDGEEDAAARADALAQIEARGNERTLQRIAAELALRNGTPEQALAAIKRYQAACPVDPWSYQQILKLALQLGDAEAAIAALTHLDRIDNQDASFAVQLASLHRASGELDLARGAIERALFREPYNASYRETAAGLALQDGATEDALFHLESLVLLEPGRAIHHTRLAAILHRMGQTERAGEAAMRARELDPKAPVERFLPQHEPQPVPAP